jgi:hypothetical protein
MEQTTHFRIYKTWIIALPTMCYFNLTPPTMDNKTFFFNYKVKMQKLNFTLYSLK